MGSHQLAASQCKAMGPPGLPSSGAPGPSPLTLILADIVKEAEGSKRKLFGATPSQRKRCRTATEKANEWWVEEQEDLVSPNVVPADHGRPGNVRAAVAMVHTDTLLAARALAGPGHSVGVLNFASGVAAHTKQLGSQEQELYLRLVTLKPALSAAGYSLEQGKIVTTTNVWERRSAGDYRVLAAPSGPYTVISAHLPKVDKHAKVTPTYIDLVKQRVDGVLRRFAAMGCNRLVLGAWGCGAFANEEHINEVAMAFAHHLAEWSGCCFDIVLFAVAGRGSCPPAAYFIFQRELSKILSLPGLKMESS